MSGFTPGPWHVFDADQSIGSVEDADGLPVAQAQQRGTLLKPRHDERRANANLIAAAPELFEALTRAVHAQDQLKCNPWIAGALAALAKARGEA